MTKLVVSEKFVYQNFSYVISPHYFVVEHNFLSIDHFIFFQK